MRHRIVGAVCGTCGDVTGSGSIPDGCFKCRARFTGETPFALIRIELRFEPGTIGIAHHLDIRGHWHPEMLADLTEAVRCIDAQ